MENIVKIEEETFGKNGGADYWLIKSLARYGFIFVIKEDEEIVSIAEYMQVAGVKELFLYGFLTKKKFRRKGYAEKLIKYCEEILKEKGYSAISLTVDPENLVAVEFYKNNNYLIIEFQENEYGEGVHRYLMKKTIV
ncbi:MAG: GNAT family N-acetyltransferase [Fusobacteriaceae bacterium]